MKTSAHGIYAIAKHEGVVPAPYLDSVDVWTFGVGHTASAGAPNPATMPRGVPAGNMAEVMGLVFATFAADLAKFEARVADAVKVQLAQHELDALVSFDFNTGGVYRANLTAALNRGDRAGAAAGFMGWLKPASIRSRREEEQRLFRDGVYPTQRVTVWGVNAQNQPSGVIATLSADDVARHLAPSAPVAPATPEPAPATAQDAPARLAALEVELDDVRRRLAAGGL